MRRRALLWATLVILIAAPVGAQYITGTGSAPVTSLGFDAITSGTNTTAAMVVGTGASLAASGSGTIDATTLLTKTWAAPDAIGSTTPAPGTFTTATATTSFTGTQGTITSSTPFLTHTATWNSGGTTFTNLFSNVTDTASASASLLADLQVGSASRFSVRKDGLLRLSDSTNVFWMRHDTAVTGGGIIGDNGPLYFSLSNSPGTTYTWSTDRDASSAGGVGAKVVMKSNVATSDTGYSWLLTSVNARQYTSGLGGGFAYDGTFTPGSGSGSYALAHLNPVINGTSSGTAYGLLLASKTNTLTGGTIKLASFGTTTTDGFTGYSPKFDVLPTGSIVSADKIRTNGTVPTVGNVGANSCGTTAATITGTDVAGKVTVGATSGTQCRVTFASAWASAPACVVTNETTANLSRATSTTTTVDLAGTFMGGDVLAYMCIGGS